MSKSIWNSLFGSTKTLSRKDLERYSSSTIEAEELRAIEARSSQSPFESDALEGWEALDFKLSKMKRLDRKFRSNHFHFDWLSGMALLVASSMVIVLFTMPRSTQHHGVAAKKTEANNRSETMQITQMELAEPEHRIAISTLVDDFREMKTEAQDAEHTIDALPLLPARMRETSSGKTIRIEKRQAPEIYLLELKTIDYSAIKLQQPQDQFVLTGTPANRETKSDNEEAQLEAELFDYREAVQQSIQLFKRENFKQSLIRFEAMIDKNDRDLNARFYGGLCLYNLKEYELSIAHFNYCISDVFSNFYEEALWYKALAYEQIGETEKAKQLYAQIVKENGFYAQEAAKK